MNILDAAPSSKGSKMDQNPIYFIFQSMSVIGIYSRVFVTQGQIYTQQEHKKKRKMGDLMDHRAPL